MKLPSQPNGLLVAALLLVVAGCNSSGDSTSDSAPDRLPPWLAKLTKQIVQEDITDPPSQIFRFRYKQKTVYYRTPYCCDVVGTLYNAKGDALCYPTGGYTGRGDGRCQDFVRTRSNCAAIWRDPRVKPTSENLCAIERGNRPLR